MRIHYMGILKNDGEFCGELVSAKRLDNLSRWDPRRGPGMTIMTIYARGVAANVKPGQRHDAEENQYIVHAYGRSEGICGVIITDDEYPTLVAHQLLSKITDEFLTKHPRATFGNLTVNKDGALPAGTSYKFAELEDYITKYQDPEQADNIMKIQRELDETKIILHKTIESVLERGQKLDDLVAQSNDLSMASKGFYSQAKKTNSCCIVM